MILDMSTYGEILLSRPAGKEALLSFLNFYDTLKPDETIVLDFSNIRVITPAWADEFITGLMNKYINIEYINTENPSINASLKFILEPIDVNKYRKD